MLFRFFVFLFLGDMAKEMVDGKTTSGGSNGVDYSYGKQLSY